MSKAEYSQILNTACRGAVYFKNGKYVSGMRDISFISALNLKKNGVSAVFLFSSK